MPLALLKSPCGPPQGVQRPAHPGHTLRDKQRCKRGFSKCRPPTDAVAPARSSEDRISRNSSSYYVRLLTTRKPCASIIGLDLALHIAGPDPRAHPLWERSPVLRQSGAGHVSVKVARRRGLATTPGAVATACAPPPPLSATSSSSGQPMSDSMSQSFWVSGEHDMVRSPTLFKIAW